MPTARCIECDDPFFIESDEQWKTRCLTCYKNMKIRQGEWEDRSTHSTRNERRHGYVRDTEPADTRVLKELKERVPALIRLCHPDKHNESNSATQITQWLLDLRNMIREKS